MFETTMYAGGSSAGPSKSFKAAVAMRHGTCVKLVLDSGEMKVTPTTAAADAVRGFAEKSENTTILAPDKSKTNTTVIAAEELVRVADVREIMTDLVIGALAVGAKVEAAVATPGYLKIGTGVNDIGIVVAVNATSGVHTIAIFADTLGTNER